MQAHLADGRVLEFPDGTDPAVIQQTVKKVIGFQQPTPPHTPSPGPVKGSILPFNRDVEGNVNFDPSAGILGAVTDALSLPGDVATGKTQVMTPSGAFNPETLQRGAALAATASPTSAATRAGEAIIPGVRQSLVRQETKTPTTQALKEAGA